jgi:hypothetical protein
MSEEEDSNETLMIVGATIGGLAVIIVIARFYVQRVLKSGIKADDWWILASLFLMLGVDILSIYASEFNPSGHHAATTETQTEDYSPEDQLYTKFSWAMSMGYFSIAATTKISILLMYKRIFAVNTVFRRLIFAEIAIVAAYWIGCTLANLLNCVPTYYVWINSLSDPRYCFNYNIFWFASGICEALIDVLIILLPIRIIHGLHLSTKHKIAVSSVFMVGVVVLLSGLLKAIFGYIPGSRQPSFGQTQLWTSVHCGTGIICASLPVCWPLFSRMGNWDKNKFLGPSFLRGYWYRLTGWVSTDKSGENSGELHSGKTDDMNIQLTNNFTSRGFDVTFSQVRGDGKGMDTRTTMV